MKYLIILLLFLSNTFIIFGQSLVKKCMYTETFNQSNSNWSIVKFSKRLPYSAYISTSGKYVCNLPSSANWGFTWINLPQEISRLSEYQDAELTFDLEISNLVNGGFSFGFMFDLHGVTNKCIGGNFYVLCINGDANTIYAQLNQRVNCNWLTDPVVKTNRKVNLMPSNKIRILKNKESYQVFINDVLSTSFIYTGNLNFSKLFWERGQYEVDNFFINKIEFVDKLEVSQPFFSNPNRPNIYVVLAGINIYNNKNYLQDNLTGCVNDAKSMYNFWSSINGGSIPESNMILLINDGATQENIIKSCNSLFSKASENDVIITYLSGHGGTGMFCSYDGGLNYERLNRIYNESKAKNKVLFIDACHSGSIPFNNGIAPRGQKLSNKEALELFYSRLSNESKGINYLLACKPDEYSSDGKINGKFTEQVIQRLQESDKTIGNNDKIVTISELYTYIYSNFQKWNLENLKHNIRYRNTNIIVKQNPVLLVNGSSDMPIAVNLE